MTERLKDLDGIEICRITVWRAICRCGTENVHYQRRMIDGKGGKHCFKCGRWIRYKQSQWIESRGTSNIMEL